MKENVENFKKACMRKLGSDFYGFVDQTASNGQMAVLTYEKDMGLGAKGKWLGAVDEALGECGFEHVSVLPYPVNGKVVYCVAGVRG